MKTKILLLITMIFILGACAAEDYKPTSIELNVDSCATCNMGIQDEQAAAQAISTDGTPYMFDDIGCLVKYIQDKKAEIGEAYVHDHHSSEWIEMDTAYFIQSPEVVSPMSYGIIAFSTEQAALEWQKKNDGDLYTQEQLLQKNVMEFKKDKKMSHDH